jgi:hypothetical protein
MGVKDRAISVLKRFPFTWISCLALLLAAWATNSLTAQLSDHALLSLGFAPCDLWQGHAVRILTSVVFTWGGLSFYGVLLLMGLSGWFAEQRLGTLRASLLFLAAHLGTTVIQYAGIALPLHLLGLPWAEGLLTAPDVGPSAGCFGCLGGLVATLPPRRGQILAGAIAAFSVLVILWNPSESIGFMTRFSSNLAHPIAAVWGYLQVRFFPFPMTSSKQPKAI